MCFVKLRKETEESSIFQIYLTSVLGNVLWETLMYTIITELKKHFQFKIENKGTAPSEIYITTLPCTSTYNSNFLVFGVKNTVAWCILTA